MCPPPIVPRSIVTGLVLLFALDLALAQGAGKPGAEPKADTPLTQCAAANRQSLADLTQAFEAARNRNRLNPVLTSRLQGFEVQLGNLRAALPRDSRNQKSCEQLTQNIATEQERLQRIASPDSQVTECTAANQLAHGQAVQMVAALPEDARGVAQPALARLNSLKPSLASEGQTIQDCKQTAAAIAQERTQIQALAKAAAASPVDSAAIDACRAANIDAYGDALRAWQDWASILGVATGAAEYDAAMLRLRRLRDEVARPGTLAECEAQMRSIALERLRAPRPGNTVTAPTPVPAPAAPPTPSAQSPAPAPAPDNRAVDCRSLHGPAYNDLARRFARLLEAGGPLASSLAMQSLGERLTSLHGQLAAGATGAACVVIEGALQQAQRELEQLASGTAPAATATPARARADA